ncbi:hypothetical protein JKP88DRAFT_285145 [Tribonema minus]|uniref:PROP1-like PPR domain-containing protein n=1 Tax=Tribonema minus TaxID=303371 RepID=A0A835ZHN3_9STRA|nr:hypothetical protein JKP88DRAFT_285145 [Tribonema minus]
MLSLAGRQAWPTATAAAAKETASPGTATARAAAEAAVLAATAAALVLRQMVDGGHKPDAALFNAVLRTNPRYRSAADGATVLSLMSRAGLPPDVKSHNLALHACCSSEAVQQADRILASMSAAGVAPDRRTFAGVLQACRYSRDWRRALEVFRDMEANHPEFADVHMWNRLLQVLVVCTVPRTTLKVAADMAERGFAPTTATYMILLQAHAALGDGAAVESVLSSMHAAGEDVTFAARAALAKGYVYGGHMEAAEEALEAVLSSDSAVNVRTDAVTLFMNACGSAGDLPRIVRWLQRLPSLGLAPTPRMWNVAVSAAHKGGDAAAADSLWRDAGGAAYFGLYKVLVPPKGGASRGWTVLVDHAAEQPHAMSVALDVSTCSVGMIHAALRAEVSRLRTQRVSAVLYIYIQTSMPHDHAIAAAEVAAVVRDHELVRRALKQLVDSGRAKDWAHLVRAHLAAGKLALGQMVDSSHKPSVDTFHTVLLAKGRDSNVAGNAAVVLRLMPQCGAPPDFTTYNTALHACRGAGAVQQADALLARAKAAGLAPDRHAFEGMLRAAPATGGARSPASATRSVSPPAFVDADMWTCLVQALAMCGQPRRLT